MGAALFVLGGEGGIQVYWQNIFGELERYFVDSKDTDTPKVNSKGVYRTLYMLWLLVSYATYLHIGDWVVKR